MSEADFEVIRDLYAATNERDWERAMSAFADDVVLEVPNTSGYLNSGTFKGSQAVGEYYGDWFRSFDHDLRFEITELTELDDGSILLVGDHHARGRASGVEVEGKVLWTYRVRDGKIVNIEGHESVEAAVRAAAERARTS